MSDPWIPYGPGCDIDPTGMEEHITYKEEVLSPDRELLRILWNALQQREERRISAIAGAKLGLEAKDEYTKDWIFHRIIEILEGTDG